MFFFETHIRAQPGNLSTPILSLNQVLTSNRNEILLSDLSGGGGMPMSPLTTPPWIRACGHST